MKKSYENSEHHLYKNYVLELGGQYDAALMHLDKIQKEVLDIQAWKEAKGDFVFVFTVMLVLKHFSPHSSQGKQNCHGRTRIRKAHQG